MIFIIDRAPLMKSSRLKNFCQVCRKQCKDQNGYHCHLNSAHHQKKLRELATNPEEHLEKYSNELENKIMQMLKVKYPGEQKNIEDIYQAYTEDKHYIRFNHTKWKDLHEFVEHLKKTGRNLLIVGKIPNCKVTYLVNKSGDFIRKKREEEQFQKKQKQKQMLQTKLEERMARNKEIEGEMFRQMKKKIQEEQQKMEQATDDKLELKFSFGQQESQKRSELFNIQEMQKQVGEDINYAPRKVKNVERLFQKLQNQEKAKNDIQQIEEEEYEWITAGIMVKIMSHQIPEAFHGKKASIISVEEPFVANLKIGSASLSIDQSYLETVIPKPGHFVKLLRGESKLQEGTLQQINMEEGTGLILISSGKTITAAFNQFSKCA